MTGEPREKPERRPFAGRGGHARVPWVTVDLQRPLRAFDRVQQRNRLLAIPVAVVKKFGDDHAGAQAAQLAYYAFFSLFPLLLVFVTILGYILAGDSGAQKTVENTVLGHFPVIGNELKEKQIHGHGAALAVGIALSLWAGLGITQAAQNAFNNVWAVPLKDRPDYLRARLRGLLVVVVLGFLFLVSSVASGLVAGGLGGVPLKVAGFALSLAINFVLFAAAFRLLTVASIPTRSLWIGAVVGGVLWELLQALGGAYVGHVVAKSSSTYGFFATVIGVLIWLRLGAQATMYAAEINVVVVRRLWPRSLLGPRLRGDREALGALAKVEERSDEEQIEVRFRS
jgi:YihY family inner membrane protein